jgi:sugar-specific transcriptional regulator TrmB
LVALLARGSATAGELSQLAGVPRSRTYDTLESLAEKGFVVIQHVKPIRFVAIPPLEAIERAKKKVEEDMRASLKRLDEFKGSEEFEELMNLFKTGLKLIPPAELMGMIRGRDSIMDRLGMMIKGADREVNIVTTPDGATELLLGNFRALQEARKRGIEIRIALPETERATDVIRTLGPIAEVKGVDEREVALAGQFCVVDGKELLLPLTDMKSVDPSQDLAVWSKSEHAARDVFTPLFKLLWSHSKELE